MLRLRHRIATMPVGMLSSVDAYYGRNAAEVHRQRLAQLPQTFKSPELRSIVIDNVAEFFWSNEKDQWDNHDFPNVAPPFPAAFIEYVMPEKMMTLKGWQPTPYPGSQVGWLCVAWEGSRAVDVIKTTLQQPQTSVLPGLAEFFQGNIGLLERGEAKWMVHATLFISHGKQTRGLAAYAGYDWVLMIAPSGELLYSSVHIHMAQSEGTSDQCLRSVGWYTLCPVLLALSFLHCKGTVVRDDTEVEGPPAKWLRQKRLPKTKYYTLQVKPMLDTIRRTASEGNTGIKRALHICRGHFRRYTEDAPLFGKYIGTCWIESHVRGSSEAGEVVKQYEVSSP